MDSHKGNVVHKSIWPIHWDSVEINYSNIKYIIFAGRYKNTHISIASNYQVSCLNIPLSNNEFCLGRKMNFHEETKYLVKLRCTMKLIFTILRVEMEK